MAEGSVQANGITLWYESFGDPADPPVVLIAGIGAQALLWPTAFCERLAGGGRCVVRFDNRETGLSSHIGPDATYTFQDMADDVVGLLDALAIDHAHIVGISMGGQIAQWAAVRHPQRVATLTSMMFGPYTMAEVAAAGLPGPHPDILPIFSQYVAGPHPETLEARIEQGVAMWRAFRGTVPFEEDEVRAREAQQVDRMWRPEAAVLQRAAGQRSPSRVEQLKQLTIPTLVIHGAEDPVVPPAHGEATAATIPGARLLLIEGLGHSLPRACWDQLVDAILQHTTPVSASP